MTSYVMLERQVLYKYRFALLTTWIDKMYVR